MALELTILHIEDEYPDFIHLVLNVRVLMEDHFSRRDEREQIARVDDKSDELEEGEGAYFVITVPNVATCHYIFVRDETISHKVSDLIKGRSVFVLDVLRPDSSGRELTSSIGNSLESVRSLGGADEDIVLFTAHRGNGLDVAPAEVPRRIGKESDGEIDEFFAEKLIECFGG